MEKKLFKSNIFLMFLKIVVGFFILFLTELVAGVFSGVFFGEFNRIVSKNVLNIFMTSLIVVAGLTILFSIYYKIVEKKKLSDMLLTNIFKKESIVNLTIGLVIGTISILIVSLPLYISGNYTISFTGINFNTILIGIILMLSVGYSEELFSRGILVQAFLFLGKIPSLIITSLLFSCLHFFNPNFQIMSFINIFLAGFTLGMTMFAFNNMWAAIGFHITWNFVQGYVLGIPVSGLDISGIFKTTIVQRNDLITGGAFGVEASIVATVVLIIISFLLYTYGKKTGNWNKN